MLHLDSGDNQRNSEGSPTKRLACRPGIVIILLSALFSFGGPLLAQNKQDDYSKAGKLFAEGANLFGKGSEASLRKAIEKFEEALALFRVLNDRADQARTLIALAQIYNILGDKQRFLDYSSQALPLNRAAGDREAEAVTLNDIGVAYSYLGEQQKALETYKQALELRQAIGKSSSELATVLINIGEVYRSLGEPEKALDYYNRALPVYRDVRDRDGEATTLNNIGQTYSDTGEKQKALDYFKQALPILRALRDRKTEAAVLINIGQVYFALGDKRKTLDYSSQALQLCRAIGDRNGQATVLNNIGLVYDDLGDEQKALNHFSQALQLFRAGSDRPNEAITLSNIGKAYSALGENQKALDYYTQALGLHRAVSDRDGEAVTLNNLGARHFALGENQKALEYYQQALPLLRAVGDRDNEAATLSNCMLASEVDNKRLAIFYGKQAVNTLQQLRANIGGLEKVVQKSFIQSRETTYRELADLLISEGRLPEAQQVLGLLKEQEYFEFVRRDASISALLKRSDLTPDEEAAVKRYNKISDEIIILAGEFSALKARGASSDDLRYQKLKTDLEAANRSFQVMLRQLGDEFRKEPEKGKDIVKELQENKGLQSDLKKWGSGTVSLYTIVGAENYHIILTTPTVQVAREAEPKIKAEDLNRLVLQFREAIQNPKVDPRPLGQQLYRILIAPIEKDLEAGGATTLLWSLDGTLRYLPIAALCDGKQYLVERYQNVLVTLASRTRLNDQPSSDWHGLGLGVSKGIVREWGTFRPLPSVPAELRAIIREENQKQVTRGVLPGRVMLDEAFTEKELEMALGRERVPLVHIASHFQFKPGNETDSFLVLGDGNRLTLDRIRVAASPFFEGVELLTLSACDTAMGGDADGKEVEGFAVLAQEQGAQAVLATLWPVADESTKSLMEKFYQNRVTKPGMAKVEALRLAQLSFLRPQAGIGSSSGLASSTDKKSSAPSFKSDPKSPFAHPYYWAPFILIGNWR